MKINKSNYSADKIRKNNYQKIWRKANPDKVRAYSESYLKRIAAKQEQEYLLYGQLIWDMSKQGDMDSKDIALKLNIPVNSVIRIYLRKYNTI
jgi:hypothetical protein